MTLMYSKPRWNHAIMERANRAVNLVKFVCSALHLEIAIVVIYQICNVDCGTFPSLVTARTYQTLDGRQCYMCTPGQFWVDDCIRPGAVAICQPCAEGHFQAVENIKPACQQCKKNCTQNEEFIEACNSTTNNICQCSSGYFKLEDNGLCKKHRTCAPGEGVITAGNKDRDTTCEICLPGKTYSINESAREGCLPCTSCAIKGLYEITPCTIRSDAGCVTSRPPDGSHNIVAIVGGTLGSLIVVLIIVLAVTVWFFKKHQRNLQIPEDDPVTESFITQPGSATSNGNNSDPHTVELQIVESTDQVINSTDQVINSTDQVINSTDDEMGHMESNEVLPDANNANSSASIHKGIRSSVLTELSNDLISHKWKFFFRALSVEESRIEEVENDHSKSIQEQIYQLLLQLYKKGTLTKSSIIKALKSVDRNDLAAKYSEEEFSES